MRKLYELIQNNLSFSRLEQIFRRSPLVHDAIPLPIITISREKGSGGRLIAEKVAKKLGTPWKVYHQEVLEGLTKESKLEKELLRQVDEHNIPVIEQMVDDFFGKKYVSPTTYYRILIKVLSAIGRRGYGVLSAGANFLLPASLKVRVICEMEQRIEWLMRYERMSRKKAIAVIDKADAERNAFVKKLYNHDPRKAHHYDLIIRTGKTVSLADGANLIVCAAKRRFSVTHKRSL